MQSLFICLLLLQLRDAALSYHNCNSLPMFRNSFALLRVIGQYKSLLTRCSDRDAANPGRFATSSSAGNEVPLLMTRQCCRSVGHCDACLFYQPEHPLSSQACQRVQMMDVDALSGGEGVRSGGCLDSATSYNTAEFVSRCCLDDADRSRSPNWTVAGYLEERRRHSGHRAGLFHDDDDDDSSVDGFVRADAARRFCRRSRSVADDVRLGSQTPDAGYHPGAEFVGLGCLTNRSVQFYAMDRRSAYGSAFLRSVFGNRVGAKLASSASDGGNSGQSSVAIVDVNVSHLHACILVL